MRILIVLPQQPRETGNWVSAERFAAGLQKAGHQVRLAESPADSPRAILAALADFAPEAALLLHAYRSGRPWLLAGRMEIPFAVLMTGTDMYLGLTDPLERLVIDKILLLAGAVLTQNRQHFQVFRGNPALMVKTHWIPAAASLGALGFPLARLVPAKKILFLHPAGIRPVKGNLELLEMFDPLASQNLAFHLAFCGPELVPAYAARLHAAIARRPWASYLGSIPQAAMASVLRQADVILNNSQSEGLSNALVEANELGRPILARHIPGNITIVKHGKNGLLFKTAEEFVSHARALASDRSLRHRLSQTPLPCYSVADEGRALAGILRQLPASHPSRSESS